MYTDKIFNLIKTDKEIVSLFAYSHEKFNLRLIIGDEQDEETLNYIQDVTWLYQSGMQELTLVGIKKNNIVICFDDQCSLDVLCSGLENLPYEIIRKESEYFNTTENLFKKRPNLKLLLIKYEAWCYQNGVVLDTEKIYHQNNGDLFLNYFENFD